MKNVGRKFLTLGPGSQEAKHFLQLWVPVCYGVKILGESDHGMPS